MFGGRWVLVLGLLTVLSAHLCLVCPAAAQPPGPAEDQDGPEAIVQVAVADLTVQGEQSPEELRQAIVAVLPAVAACLQGEYQRLGKVPAKITLRFNLSGSGKVVWTKLIDPPLKSLDTCLAKALASLRLPATGTTLSRATVVLECRSDHLLTP